MIGVFTFRKNTIIHCFHGSYSSRGLLFRYPITIEDYPRQGVGAARSAARTRPLNGTPTSILWNGDDDRRETSPYQTSSCSALAGTKEQGEAPSGARVAASSQRRREIPEACAWSQSQSSALWTTTPPTQVWTAYSSVVPTLETRSLSNGFLGLKR